MIKPTNKHIGSVVNRAVMPLVLGGIGLATLLSGSGCATASGPQAINGLPHKDRVHAADFSTGAYHVFEMRNYSFSPIHEENGGYAMTITFREGGKTYAMPLKSNDKGKLQRVRALEDKGGEIALGVDCYPSFPKGFNWTVYHDGTTLRNASSPDAEMGARILFGQYLSRE